MIFLQNEINWSCAGDSGSPLVKVVHPPSGQPYFKLIGVLHGSKSNCNTRPRTEASMFANLENSKTQYFIQRNQPGKKGCIFSSKKPKVNVSFILQ